MAEEFTDTLPRLNAEDFLRDPFDVDFVLGARGFQEEQTISNIRRSGAESIELAGGFTDANVTNFQDVLGRVAPQAVELQSSRDAQILDFLAGRVPEEVSQSTAQARAETGAITGAGSTSGFTQDRLFRDFGINALDAIQFGIGASTSALAQQFGLSQFLLEKPSSFFGTNLGALQGATVADFDTIINASAQAEVDNQKIAFDVAEQNLQNTLSEVELTAGADSAERLRRAQLRNDAIKAGAMTMSSQGIDLVELGKLGITAIKKVFGVTATFARTIWEQITMTGKSPLADTLYQDNGRVRGNVDNAYGVSQNPETGDFEVQPLSLQLDSSAGAGGSGDDPFGDVGGSDNTGDDDLGPGLVEQQNTLILQEGQSANPEVNANQLGPGG